MWRRALLLLLICGVSGFPVKDEDCKKTDFCSRCAHLGCFFLGFKNGSFTCKPSLSNDGEIDYIIYPGTGDRYKPISMPNPPIIPSTTKPPTVIPPSTTTASVSTPTVGPPSAATTVIPTTTQSPATTPFPTTTLPPKSPIFPIPTTTAPPINIDEDEDEGISTGRLILIIICSVIVACIFICWCTLLIFKKCQNGNPFRFHPIRNFSWEIPRNRMFVRARSTPAPPYQRLGSVDFSGDLANVDEEGFRSVSLHAVNEAGNSNGTVYQSPHHLIAELPSFSSRLLPQNNFVTYGSVSISNFQNPAFGSFEDGENEDSRNMNREEGEEEYEEETENGNNMSLQVAEEEEEDGIQRGPSRALRENEVWDEETGSVLSDLAASYHSGDTSSYSSPIFSDREEEEENVEREYEEQEVSLNLASEESSSNPSESGKVKPKASEMQMPHSAPVTEIEERNESSSSETQEEEAEGAGSDRSEPRNEWTEAPACDHSDQIRNEEETEEVEVSGNGGCSRLDGDESRSEIEEGMEETGQEESASALIESGSEETEADKSSLDEFGSTEFVGQLRPHETSPAAVPLGFAPPRTVREPPTRREPSVRVRERNERKEREQKEKEEKDEKEEKKKK